MKTYEEYNPNPTGRRVDDCTVRAISKALGITWGKAYDLLSDKGRELGNMMHADSVWGAVLREKGFVRHAVPNTCPYCYTAENFTKGDFDILASEFGAIVNRILPAADGGAV